MLHCSVLHILIQHICESFDKHILPSILVNTLHNLLQKAMGQIFAIYLARDRGGVLYNVCHELVGGLVGEWGAEGGWTMHKI